MSHTEKTGVSTNPIDYSLLPTIRGNVTNGASYSTHHQNRPKKSNRILMKKRIKLRHKKQRN